MKAANALALVGVYRDVEVYVKVLLTHERGGILVSTMLVRRIACHAPRRSFLKHSQQWHARSRRMSSAAPTASQPLSTSGFIAGITTELDRLAPRVDIRADQVQILEGPKEFYDTLREKIGKAKERIYLATLYVGRTENELMSCIQEALENNPNLKVSILTDALRGTRETPDPSCASLLAALAMEFPSRVEIRMYHTPNLTGLRRKYIPRRINEGWGLQHMKLYGIDDEIILSGANLSNDYFTNRQDRYHVFSSRRVTDYYAKIHDTLCSVSFLLRPGADRTSYTLGWPSTNASSSPLDNPKDYISTTKALFAPLSAPLPPSSTRSCNTIIYPLLIIPHAINTELPALQALLGTSSQRIASYLFTAGYFNPHPTVTSALLSAAAAGATGIVVTASPWANGFYGSKGVSGMLPAAYTLLSRRFLEAASKIASGRVELREWRLGTVGRPHGWTYHAKGLWLTYATTPPAGENMKPSETLESESGPSVTVIGSSNYTVRSYSLDTEVGAVVVTSDEGLKRRLRQEEENLLKYSRTATEQDLKGGERRVGLGVRLAMWVVKAVGGSL